MNFKDLKLSEKILDAIAKMGYIEATPIQEQAIPEILKGKDIIGLAQTGTGKTAAFSLPIIDKLIRNYHPDRKIKVLILSPTRELAIQIRDNIIKYTEGTNFKCSVILGGVNQRSQEELLRRGLDILVATPGRLLDLIKQRKADISNVKMLVLDEADTMLDMGFIKDVKDIMNRTSKERQTLLFSATMPNEIKDLTGQFMKEPITIKIRKDEIDEKIEQELYYVDSPNKINLLLDIISTQDLPTTLIFTRTKHDANRLEEKLLEFNIKTSVIHGNKTQSSRVKALNDFKNKKTRIMIATDIAAHGIDINNLGLVVNYNIPEKAEIYIHRIGRTARAGKDGKAVSFCASSEIKDLMAIEKLINQKIKVINHKYPMVLSERKPAQRNGRVNKPNFSNKPNNNYRRNKPKSYRH